MCDQCDLSRTDPDELLDRIDKANARRGFAPRYCAEHARDRLDVPPHP